MRKRIENRIDRQSRAFTKAMDWCRLYGLDWRDHIKPIIQDKEIVGYSVLDETFCPFVEELFSYDSLDVKDRKKVCLIEN